MNAAHTGIGVGGRALAGWIFAGLALLAVVGATQAEGEKQGILGGPNSPHALMQPLSVQVLHTAAAADAPISRVVSTGAVAAALNCDEWPDYCYLSANRRTLFVQLGSASGTAVAPLAMPLPGIARIAAIADFIPGECEEIVIATDGGSEAERRVVWFRRSGGTVAQFKDETRSGVPLCGAVADLDLLVVGGNRTADFIVVEKASKTAAAQVVAYRWTGPLVGDGTKRTVPVMSKDDEPTSIDPADIDDDKDLDLQLKTSSSSQYSFFQLRQTLVNKVIDGGAPGTFDLAPAHPVEVPE